MGNAMSRLLKSSIVSSLGLIILGVLLIIQSEATIMSISYIIGGVLIALGVIAIIKFANNKDLANKNELDIVYGLVCAILGIVIITNPQAIASLIPFVIGMIIVINSSLKLYYSIEIRKESNDLWKPTAVISLIAIICGLLLIFNPFKGAVLIMRIVGILIIVYALLDIVSTITIKRTTKKIHKAIEQKITEAEIVEDKTDKNKKVSKDEGKIKMNNAFPMILGIIDTINKLNDKLNAFAEKYLGNVLSGTVILGVILFVAVWGVNTFNKK